MPPENQRVIGEECDADEAGQLLVPAEARRGAPSGSRRHDWRKAAESRLHYTAPEFVDTELMVSYWFNALPTREQSAALRTVF